MPTTTITQTLVKNLIANPPPAPTDCRDAALTGFVLRCRPSGIHTFRVQTGRGKWFTLGTTDKLTVEQARTEAKRVLGKVALGHDPVEEKRAERQAKHTLGSYITDEYADWVRTHNRTGDETVKRLQSVFADLLSVRLVDLTAHRIETWKTKRRQEGTTAITVNRDLSDLKAMLGRAVKWGHLSSNPLASVVAEKRDTKPPVRFLQPDEVQRLRGALRARDIDMHLAHASHNRWCRERGLDALPPLGEFADHVMPVVLLAMNTGMRRGELLKLRWKEVDMRGRRITVHPETSKTGETRHIPMNAEVVRVLTLWGVRRDNSLVFPGPRPDTPMESIKTAWANVLEAACITNFRFHDLRHHFASMLVQRGVDLNVVRELMGHTTMAMTLRYAHLAPEQGRAAVAVLDD